MLAFLAYQKTVILRKNQHQLGICMTTSQHNNPLHGVTLQLILDTLVAQLGWDKMAETVNINCFKSEPSIKSSLKFLRKTPWAREQVEQLYLTKIAKQPHAKTTTTRDDVLAKTENAEFVWPDVNKPG